MADLSFIQGGEISGNVDNDMNVRFICKRRSSPISRFFPRNAPLTVTDCFEIATLTVMAEKIGRLTSKLKTRCYANIEHHILDPLFGEELHCLHEPKFKHALNK